MEFLKTLGITIVICGILTLFLYGVLLVVEGNSQEAVFGKVLSAVIVFVGTFLAVHFGRR